MKSKGNAVDALRLPVLWGRLVSVADEAALTLVRTAFSSILRDANDYSCMLLDHKGRAIVENTWAIPNFVGCLSKTMGHILCRYPADTWQSGDVVITNDPWISTGHLPDFSVISPIFHRGKLIGFGGSVAHHLDVGGSLWSADTTELYEEGLRVPIERLYRGGEPNETLIELIRANVRVPDYVIGDLHAQIAANRTIEIRIKEMVEEDESLDLSAIGQSMQLKAEESMRQALSMLPTGTFRSNCTIDGFEEPLDLQLSIKANGGQVELDYSGSANQQPHAINVPMVNTYSMSCYIIKALLDPTTPRNEGSYHPITVTAPEGSILNPLFPAAVNARHLTFLHFSSLIFQALAEVLPEQVLAESGSPFIQAIFAGYKTNGKTFVHATFDSAGMGARFGHDGLSATPFPNNTGGAPIENVEATVPLLFHEKRLVSGSGGAGEFRGGLGTQIIVEVISKQPTALSLMGDRIVYPARGICGGSKGLNAKVLCNGKPISAKGRFTLQSGDKLTIRNAGGGGYGCPSQRDRKKIEWDLLNEYITEKDESQYN